MRFSARLGASGPRWLVVGLGIVFILYFMLFGRTAYEPRGFNFDFVAFYCAGEVANNGADPYLTEPLRSCERRVGPAFRKGSVLVLPAPLPAYDVEFFRLVAQLPFWLASSAWFGFLLIVFLLSVWSLWRSTRLPLWSIFAVLGLSLGYVSLSLGQIAPLSIFGLILLGDAMECGSPYLAFLGCILAAFEPHLALAGLASAMINGSTLVRFGLLGGAGWLLGLSWLALPFATAVEYFIRVLPAHALSEINNREQFSLAHYLHLLGINEAWSVHISEISYILMVVLAVALSRRMGQRFGKNMTILGPTACSLLVSPFLHVTQIAAAAPAGLVAFARSRSRVIGLSLICVAIPWIDFVQLLVVAPIAIGAFAAAAWLFVGLRPTLGILISFGGIAACCAAAYDFIAAPRHVLHYTSATATSLAEVSWRQAVDLAGVGHDWAFIIAKAPAHFSIILLVTTLVMVCLKTPWSAWVVQEPG